MLKIFIHQEPKVSPNSEIRIYFYDRGETRGYQLVAIERPEEPDIPELY
jgi:hypothetical protein